MRNNSSHEMERVERSKHSQRQELAEIEVPSYFVWKRLWARLAGATLLVFFSPLILILVSLVRLTSKGPALFKQVRVGKDGREFEVLKIRTMYQDAEKECGAVLCKPGDSRITPIGKLLRFLHLDELPQLINVMRGEMCLIGPRPERPEIIEEHDLINRVPGFSERTKVLPGVTGLAQINLPPDQTAACVIPKVKLDLEYISTAGIGLDTRILLCTFLRMLGIRHGHAVHFFRLFREVVFREIPEEKKRPMWRRFGAKTPKLKPKPEPQPTAAMATASVSEESDYSIAVIETSLDDADENEDFGHHDAEDDPQPIRRLPR